ncbi:amino acid ABC transporter substrate-binding protein, PAAT family [Limimonas halophila]|uniref:Amino acid ABC transporter substrate-binding protein, PAAT family n=1 Tax=Limimonas halophila TaxID=1082479 RepID=A0A1G7RED5_9PROT|nr:transporter substrate-binding domain-containing protein [Limimonas halophila]SDG08539.1 amino acid ABC transporter substrate-binding protein, PAAT family [Limimonas halophila]
MIGFKRIAIWALAALLLVPGAAHAQRELTVAALTGWPPFSDEGLPANGFANEVITVALKRAGYDARVEMMPWPEAKASVMAGEHDVLSSVWHTEARAEKLAFTDPVAENRIVFIAPAESPFTYTGLDSLKGKTVAVAEEYHYAEAFLESDAFTRLENPNLVAGLFQVANGEADLAVGDELTARYLIGESAKRFEGMDFALSERALSERPLHVGVSRAVAGTQAIVTAFNEALAAMRKEGTYVEIKEKHGLTEADAPQQVATPDAE